MPKRSLLPPYFLRNQYIHFGSFLCYLYLRNKIQTGKTEELHFIKIWENIVSTLFLRVQKFVGIKVIFCLLSKRGFSAHSLAEGPSVKIIPRNFGSISESSVNDLQ